MRRSCLVTVILLALGLLALVVFVNRSGWPLCFPHRPPGIYSTPSARCQQNLQQISIAILVWSGDHGEAMPSDLGQLIRYVGGQTELFCCPSLRNVPGKIDDIEDWSSYTYVTNLYSRTLTNTIIAFCRSTKHVGYRGGVDTGGHLLIRDREAIRYKWVPFDVFGRFLSELKTRRTDECEPKRWLQEYD